MVISMRNSSNNSIENSRKKSSQSISAQAPMEDYEPLLLSFSDTLYETASTAAVQMINNDTLNNTISKTKVATAALIIPTRAVFIVASFVLFLICFLLRNRQPIKSRSLLPFLVLIMCIGSSFGHIEDAIPADYFFKSARKLSLYRMICCYLRIFIVYPTFILAIVSYMLVLARYFLLNSIMKMKEALALKLRGSGADDSNDMTDLDFDMEDTEMDDAVKEMSSSTQEVDNSTNMKNRRSVANIQTLVHTLSDMESSMATSEYNNNTIKNNATTATNNDTNVVSTSETKSKHLEISRLLAIFEFLVSKKMIALVVIVSLTIWYIIALIVIGVTTQFKCVNSISLLSLLLSVVFMIALIVFPIVLGIDVIVNFKLIVSRCGVLQYLLFSDPLFFRLEMWLIAITGLPSLLIEIIVTTIVGKHSNPEAKLLTSVTIRTFLFDLLCMLIIVPGIAMVLSIRNWILEVKQRKFIANQQDEKPSSLSSVDLKVYNPSDATILCIIKNKKTCALFREYLRRELSLENLMFVEDVHKYKKIGKRKHKKRYEKAKIIANLYLKISSKLEVNVTEKEKISCLAIIEQYDPASKAELSNALFQEVQTSVIRNLIDSYSRFFHSSNFQELVATL